VVIAVWQYINPVTTSGVLKQGVTAAQNSVFSETFLSQISVVLVGIHPHASN
jgi:hypothetical protein